MRLNPSLSFGIEAMHEVELAGVVGGRRPRVLSRTQHFLSQRGLLCRACAVVPDQRRERGARFCDAADFRVPVLVSQTKLARFRWPGAISVLPSCATPDAGTPGATAGHRLYLTCAGSCHSPEPVRNYSTAQWEEILPEMMAEAKLTPPEAQELKNYVFGQLGDG